MGVVLGARIRCGPFGAGLHSFICWSLRLIGSTPACGSKVRLCEPVLIHRAEDYPTDEDLSVGAPIAMCFHLPERWEAAERRFNLPTLLRSLRLC